MRYHFNKQDDALYVRFHDAAYAESDEVREGVIFDYDRRGKLLGIEILDASKRFPRKFARHIARGHKERRVSVSLRAR